MNWHYTRINGEALSVWKTTLNEKGLVSEDQGLPLPPSSLILHSFCSFVFCSVLGPESSAPFEESTHKYRFIPNPPKVLPVQCFWAKSGYVYKSRVNYFCLH